MCVVGLRLGDRVLSRGQNELARLGGGACWSGERFSRGMRRGKASALPGFCGGAALWTLLYHRVELTLSAV